MRQIETHKVNGCNEIIQIEAIDEPGHGGANHRYMVTTFDPLPDGMARGAQLADLKFQNGPIAEVGTNGITHEVLLAILIDRMQGFQKGQYACRENALALTHLEDAMHWLQHRTRQRVARGVEGTHEK